FLSLHCLELEVSATNKPSIDGGCELDDRKGIFSEPLPSKYGHAQGTLDAEKAVIRARAGSLLELERPDFDLELIFGVHLPCPANAPHQARRAHARRDGPPLSTRLPTPACGGYVPVHT